MADRSTIPQFTGAAYQGWAYKVRYGLMEKDLHSCVFGFRGGARTPCPVLIPLLTQAELLALPSTDVGANAVSANIAVSANSQRDVDAWLLMDMKAQAFIVKYLGASEHTHVRNCVYAYEMWESLRSFYELQGEIEIANAQAQLSAIIMTESEPITAYVRRLQDLHSLLDRLGESVPATKQATNLLNSLNTRYAPMVDNIQTWSQTAPHLYTVQNILSTLLQKDVREEINARKRGEPLGGGERPQAHYGGAGPSARHSGSSRGDKSGIQCHRCEKYGHFMRDCPQSGPMKCHKCGKPGHVKAMCRAGNEEKQQGGGKNLRCAHCKKTGHSVDSCFVLKRDKEGAARLAANSPSDYDASDDSLVYSASSSVFSSSTHPKMPLVLDSGATDHIFPSSSCFTEYSTKEIPLQCSFIYTADGKPHEVIGSGIVTLLLHNGMEQTTARIHALHVPSLNQTLISLGCINRRGKVAFNLSKAGVPTLTRNDKPWADLKTTSNGLLILSGRIVMPGPSTQPVNDDGGHAFSAGTDWHLRLGHPGLTMMRAMSGKGLIPSLTTSEIAAVQSCEVCCQAKMSQSPHKHVSESTEACQKMDRVHLDLSGPMAVASHHGGHSYFQAGMEIGCRLSFVHLLKHKSDALAVSKNAIAALESESGKSLKSLRTDGGGEYTSAAWGQYAMEKGINHELTAPYSPQQNGMAERLNRTLLEKMRCLLIWSKLPKSYWGVALLHANWLRNRLPTSALKGGVPIEAWTGRKHNLKMNHTFGCLVQYLKVGADKDPKSAKFASRTSFGIFLGMPVGQSGFLVFDPTRSGVLVRSDVKFFDDIPGYPRLMSAKARMEATPPRDDDFFTYFPDEDDAAPAPVPQPPLANDPPPTSLPHPITPIDVIQVSDDTELGVDNDNEDEEVDWVTTQEESIADRVSARRRAHFASFGDVL